MTAIWHKDGDEWKAVAPRTFELEDVLHSLVEETPQLLPLAGQPRIAILGREVQLGAGYADLVGIESTGRVVIIEVKLSQNPEARRSIVAQILAYAAVLRGMTVSQFESEVLASHLRRHGFETIAEAMASADQAGRVDAAGLSSGLGASLASGHFRLVLVLDSAPDELVDLVGYLEAMADGLVIDLVTVSAYEVEGAEILVPQRVDPEYVSRERSWAEERRPASDQGVDLAGASEFAESIESAPEEHRDELRRLLAWARELESEGVAVLHTYRGKGRWTLRPLLKDEGVGLVTVWNDHGAYVSVWRNVFERRAPDALKRIEAAIAPEPVGQGNTLRNPRDEVLALFTDAYREAVRGA